MNRPPPPDEPIHPEDLPLRHRPTREREAEKIRQDFIRSQRKMMLHEAEPPVHEFRNNEP